MSRISSLTTMLLIAMGAANLTAQQNNSVNAGLDVNGSSSSGSAPFNASVELTGPLFATISGAADTPFVLLAGPGLSVGNIIFDGTRQIDVGPTLSVLVDGLAGPFNPFNANTGPTGSINFQTVVSGATPTGSVQFATQAVIVDFVSPPFNVSISAATAVSFTADVGTNSPPVADAGDSIDAVFVNGCHQFDGSASADPEGSLLTYLWTQVGGGLVTLVNPTTATPTFTAPASATTLHFELVVDDGVNSSVADQVQINVLPVASPVSFSADVIPIFTSRGCVGCHGSVSPGGGQNLTGTANDIYTTLMTDVTEPLLSGPRANPCDPAGSPVLLKPLSVLSGGIIHSGGNIFPDQTDADYVTIFDWLTQGALNN